MRNEYQRAERQRIEDICYRALLDCQLKTGLEISYKQMITLASKMADEMEMK